MRLRLTTLAMISLLLAALACNRQTGVGNFSGSPAQPVAGNQPAAASDEAAPKAASALPGTGGETTARAANQAGDSTAERARSLPAGSVLTVRLRQAVGSKISHSGDRFEATVAQPIERDGAVIVPEGAQVIGRVQSAAARGRFKGAAVLRLTLDSLTVKDKSYPLDTSSISRSMTGKGKRTAVLTGGGAGLGAVIGGLAGGGKGAAIGALAGAGAGTAGSAFTGNQNIVLPAESALSFTLKEPVILR